MSFKTERQLGVDLFNATWAVLERESRTRENDDELVHVAHASAYHWLKAPECEPKHRARSEWMCSRVYSVLGRAEPALHHARRCLELCEQSPDNLEDWDLPYAHEALARAHGVAGEAEAAAEHEAIARELGDKVADQEDKDLLFEALGSLPRRAG